MTIARLETLRSECQQQIRIAEQRRDTAWVLAQKWRLAWLEAKLAEAEKEHRRVSCE